MVPKVAKGTSKLQRHTKTRRSWGCNSTNLLYMCFHANFRRFYAFLVQFFLGKSALVEVIWFENEERMHLQKSQLRKW